MTETSNLIDTYFPPSSAFKNSLSPATAMIFFAQVVFYMLKRGKAFFQVFSKDSGKCMEENFKIQIFKLYIFLQNRRREDSYPLLFAWTNPDL
jgi:hypothetical protein